MSSPVQRAAPASNPNKKEPKVFKKIEIIEESTLDVSKGLSPETLLILNKSLKSQGGLASLLSGGNAVSTQPLVCLKGDERPPLVGEHQGADGCGLAQAKQAQNLALQAYESECVQPVQAMERRIGEKVAKRLKLDQEELTFIKNKGRFVSVNLMRIRRIHPLADRSFEVPATAAFKFQATDCEAAQYSIPVTLKELGLENAEGVHPLFSIVQRLNVDQLHDFRSASSFLRVAQNMEYGLMAAKQRSLTLSYPASGSHLAPLVIPFQLIDDRVIDEASLNFTEIDEESSKRIFAYLKALTASPLDPADPNGGKLITNLKNEKVLKNPGYEMVYRFRYRDKPVTLTVALNRSGDKYIEDSYLKTADLVILHDLNNQAESKRIVETATKFQRDNRPRAPLWIVSDEDNDALKGLGTYQGFEGRFGCGNVELSGRFFADKTWRFIEDVGGGILVPSERSIMDPFARKSDFDSIQVHLKQKTIPVRLIQVGGQTGLWSPQGI